MDVLYSLPGIHQPLSSMSHLTGAVVFAWLSFYLLRPVWGNWPRFFGVALFATAAVALLTISSIYHMFFQGEYLRSVMLRIDLAAIFVLIAATFTPIHGLMFSGWRRWGVLALIWSIAFAGILARMIFFESISRPTGAIIFLAMGWIGGYTAWLLWRSEARHLLLPAVAGGVFYSIGAIANATGWPILITGVWGPHETLHFAVLAGLGSHWAVISGVIEHTPVDWQSFASVDGQTEHVDQSRKNRAA